MRLSHEALLSSFFLHHLQPGSPRDQVHFCALPLEQIRDETFLVLTLTSLQLQRTVYISTQGGRKR